MVGHGLVVEHRECCVEMVETRIDQSEADDRHADRGRDLGVCADVGAETMPRQQDSPGHEQVALPFVDVVGAHRGVAVPDHPLRVRVGLGRAL